MSLLNAVSHVHAIMIVDSSGRLDRSDVFYSIQA